jgi:hypothetical protein
MAWRKRRERRVKNMPSLLLGKDIDDMRTMAGIERAVLNVLRRLGMLPPEPQKASPRWPRLVESNDKTSPKNPE